MASTTRAERRARGQCTECARPAEPNRAKCRPCLDSQAARRRRKCAQLREAGQCTDCPAPAEPGKRRCRSCLDRQATEQARPERRAAEADSKRRVKRRKLELRQCVECKRPAAEGISRCEGHARMKNLKAQRKRLLANLRAAAPTTPPPEGVRKCGHCKRPADDGLTRCRGHQAAEALLSRIKTERRRMGYIKRTPERRERDRAQALRAWRRRAKRCAEAGLCVRCQRVPAMPGITECEGCRAKTTEAHRTLYHTRRITGLCVECGAERLGDCTAALCEPCATRQRERCAARNAKLRAEGRCVRCKADKRQDGYALCPPCRATLEALDAKAGIITAPDGAGVPRYHVWAGDGADLGEWDCEAEALAAASFGGAEGFAEAVDDDASAWARMVSRDGSPPPER